MAEICVEIVSESKSEMKTEPVSRAARRKRMEIRKLKLITGTGEFSTSRKRRKISIDQKENDDSQTDDDSQNSNSSSNESSVEVVSTSPSISLSTVTVTVKDLISDRCPKFGMSSICGWRRDMEDAVSIYPSFSRSNSSETPVRFHYFGVYDGHGCSHVAMNCRDRLHQLVKEEIENSESSSSSFEWKTTMERSFNRMDKEVLRRNNGGEELNPNCRCELQTPKCDAVGSTAVVSILTPDKIIVANCGDSRAVLCRSGKAIAISIDHKPDRPDELLRIQNSGGRVIYWDGARVLGVLAMSRAIGDNYLKPYVIPEPEITITDRTAEDECLIIASDGLWDVVSNDTACNIVRMCLNSQGADTQLTVSENGNEDTLTNVESSDKCCSDAALLLTKLALARHSTDNVSVIVVDLRKTK